MTAPPQQPITIVHELTKPSAPRSSLRICFFASLQVLEVYTYTYIYIICFPTFFLFESYPPHTMSDAGYPTSDAADQREEGPDFTPAFLTDDADITMDPFPTEPSDRSASASAAALSFVGPAAAAAAAATQGEGEERRESGGGGSRGEAIPSAPSISTPTPAAVSPSPLAPEKPSSPRAPGGGNRGRARFTSGTDGGGSSSTTTTDGNDMGGSASAGSSGPAAPAGGETTGSAAVALVRGGVDDDGDGDDAESATTSATATTTAVAAAAVAASPVAAAHPGPHLILPSVGKAGGGRTKSSSKSSSSGGGGGGGGGAGRRAAAVAAAAEWGEAFRFTADRYTEIGRGTVGLYASRAVPVYTHSCNNNAHNTITATTNMSISHTLGNNHGISGGGEAANGSCRNYYTPTVYTAPAHGFVDTWSAKSRRFQEWRDDRLSRSLYKNFADTYSGPSSSSRGRSSNTADAHGNENTNSLGGAPHQRNPFSFLDGSGTGGGGKRTHSVTSSTSTFQKQQQHQQPTHYGHRSLSAVAGMTVPPPSPPVLLPLPSSSSPPASSSEAMERARIRAIAAARRSRELARDETVAAHGQQLLARRSRSRRGEPVDLPRAYYETVLDVFPDKAGTHTRTDATGDYRDTIMAVDHRQAVGIAAAVRGQRRYDADEARREAVVADRAATAEALAAARRDTAAYISGLTAGLPRISRRAASEQHEAATAGHVHLAREKRLEREARRRLHADIRADGDADEADRQRRLQREVVGDRVVAHRGGAGVNRYGRSGCEAKAKARTKKPKTKPTSAFGRASTYLPRGQLWKAALTARNRKRKVARKVASRPSSPFPSGAAADTTSRAADGSLSHNHQQQQQLPPEAAAAAPGPLQPTSANFFSEVKAWTHQFQSPNTVPVTAADPAVCREWRRQLRADRVELNRSMVGEHRAAQPQRLADALDSAAEQRQKVADLGREDKALLQQRRSESAAARAAYAGSLRDLQREQRARVGAARAARAADCRLDADTQRARERSEEAGMAAEQAADQHGLRLAAAMARGG